MQPEPRPLLPSPAPAGEAPTLLLVDDDMELRKDARDFLHGAGFHVLEARNSYDGLFLCAQHGHGIDVLITEINLLPVGGMKLAENIARVWPQIRIICMSRHHDAPGVEPWLRLLGARFLRKPFAHEELRACVLAALACPARRSGLPPAAENPRGRYSEERKMLD
jgi:DNA-binding NtrC family response regulator